MNKKITIVGMGMGRRDMLTQEALNAIDASDCLIGSKRLIEFADNTSADKFTMTASKKIADFIKADQAHMQITVLMSGDVGFYSGTKPLVELLKDYDITCICGISSIMYLCSKLMTSWDDAYIVSMHGRENNLCAAVALHPKVFVLTDGEHTVSSLCADLCENELSEVMVSVGENLSYENERIMTAKAGDLTNTSFDSLSVMLIINPSPLKKQFSTQGLPDDVFIRGNVPMTKSEVRSVSISKMQLKGDEVVYDIGAGTGSIAIETALVCSQGTVYAIEKKKEAVELIKRNRDKFGVKNLKVVEGSAPEACKELPKPDTAFIGGSSGNMHEIVNMLLVKNKDIRIVVNAITLETLTETLQSFKDHKFNNIDIVQIQISVAKNIADYHMMQGSNPIYILSAGGYANEM